MSISWDDAAKNESSRLQIILVADTWDYMSRPESESWRSCVEGGGRTIKASMSQLYYVPACVSSLMQSLCPPNVTHTRIYARARGERFFVLHKRNFFLFFFLLQTHFSWNWEIRFPRSLFIYFLCASLLSSDFIRSSLSRPQRATQRERAGSLDN